MSPPNSLQWGRATEGPERRSNSPASTELPRLQWGRATEGPESSPSQVFPALEALASMGPGHGGPGEGRTRPRTDRPTARFNGAGPRRARRADYSYKAGFVAELQWGRATEGPESNVDEKARERLEKLQWGRATEGPES